MLRTKLIQVLSGAAVMLCLAAAEARACRCFLREEPCSLYWSADVVFAGTVTEVGPLLPVEGQPNVLTSGGRATRFSVTEALRGVEGDAVETYEHGTSCDFHFRAGGRYLVYAARNPRDGRLYVNSCSGTKEIERASFDLDFARGIAAGRATPSLVGRVEQEVRASVATYREKRPLDDVEVVVEGGGRTSRARTDAAGRFSVYDLRPGTYSVRARAAPNLRHLYNEPVQRAEVLAGRCTVVTFTVTWLARVGGRVVGHDGAPAVRTRVNLVPVGDDGRDAEPAEGTIEAYTDESGRYEFNLVAPGRYRVAVNPRGQPASYDPPYTRLFLPGVRDPARAAVVSVSDGAAHEAEEFRLPPPLVARELEGVVVWPDGRPAPRALLSLEFTDREWAETTDSADEQGRFKLKVYEGFTYVVGAEVRAQNAAGVWTGRHSSEVEVTVGETNEPLRLVIDREGFHRPRYQRRQQEKQK